MKNTASLFETNFVLTRQSIFRRVTNVSRVRSRSPQVNERICSDLDWELTCQAKQGDESAFAELVSRHQTVVSKITSRYARCCQDQDELVNEVFAEVFFSLKNFHGRSRFQTWIATIATRYCYRYLKRKKREQQLQSILQWVGIKQGPIEQTMAESDSAREKLETLLTRLSVDDRMVLTLLYWEECSVSEAAQRLNWSVSKTKVRAHRARQKMKRMLDGANHG